MTSGGVSALPRPGKTGRAERPRVAIVGMGAVGTALAAWFAAAGYPTVACSPRAPERPCVLVDSGEGPREHPVEWHISPASLTAPADWVFVATKLHQTPAAADWFAALAQDTTTVVAAQNGVDHRERLASLTSASIVPALVYVNAERLAVGSVRVRRTQWDFIFPDDDQGRRAATLCKSAEIAARTDPDFVTETWRKLLANAAANPLTALTGRRVEALREPPLAKLALTLIEETALVARANGARLSTDSPRDTLRWLQELAPGTTTSMLQDREAGRQLEFDGLTGTVVRFARRAGIETPVNDAILALLSGLGSNLSPRV